MGLREALWKAYKMSVVNMIASACGVFMITKYVLTFIRHPLTQFWRVKTRNEYPQLLKDKELGEHKFIKIKDMKIHYVENGDSTKPLLLFLHGFPEFWYSWRYQLKEFSKDYWTVAVDLRGYGESTKPRNVRDYRIKEVVEDVKDVIQALGRDKCILVAHDWGGIIGHVFIRKYPEMVQKYIFLNTVHARIWKRRIFTNFTQFYKALYVFFFQLPYIGEFTIQSYDYALLDRLFNKKNATEEELEAYKYIFRSPGYVVGPLNYFRALFAKSPKVTSQLLNELNIPGLYLHGERDSLYSLDLALTDSFRDIKNIKFKMIKGANHFVQQSAHQEVNSEIAEFLAA